jgi:hypothetical protein
MTPNVRVDAEIVRSRLLQLEQLADQMDRIFRSVGDIGRRQGPAVWSTVPACQQFAAHYARALRGTVEMLVAERAELARLGDVLATNARALDLRDQDVQDRLAALVRRLAAPPPEGGTVCTPYDSATPPPNPSSGPGPSPSPSPSPHPGPSPSPAPAAP